MKKRFGRTLLIAFVATLLLVYVTSWIVMPRLGMTYELNFDHGCDAGLFGLLDMQGSTCASGGPAIVGFPLSVYPGSLLNIFLTITIDVIPAIALILLLRHLCRPLTTRRRTDTPPSDA